MGYDLKAATPDGTFGDGAYLFGADSQSASLPSVFPEQAIRDYWASLNWAWEGDHAFAGEVDLSGASVVGLLIGTDVQAWDADLDAIAALDKTDSNIIVGNGTTWVAESGATARTSLGLGTGNSPQFTAIELGAASDTTLARASAGDMSIEGNLVYRAGGTDVPIADGGTGASTAAAARTNLSVRELLTANRTYYVSTTGSDSADGLTVGTPFLTVNAAILKARAIDPGIYTVSVSLAAGTYTGNHLMSGPLIGGTRLTIFGATGTASDVLLTSSSGTAVTIRGGGALELKDLRVGSASDGIAASDGARCYINNVEFRTCTRWQIYINTGALVEAEGNYSISQGAARHINCSLGARYQSSSKTITVSGTPAFTEFVNFSIGGQASLFATTFSGAATGTRYTVGTNSVVQTFSGGASFFPGDVAGSTSTGGSYT